MASYLKPRRGRKGTAISQEIILKRGEFFMEYPDDGPGTGEGRLKMGDGTTKYVDLPYFIDPSTFVKEISTEKVTFTETHDANDETIIARIQSQATLATIVAATKNLLSNYRSEMIQMQTNFQAGVDSVYDAVVAKGSIPASKALSDVIAAIGAIETTTIHTGTYTPTQRSVNNDMGETHNYRYVNTTNVPNANSGTYSITSNGIKDMGETNSYQYAYVNVPNSNSGTYEFPTGSRGGIEDGDMGATNNKRYVIATAVYNKGSSDGYASGYNQGTSDGYASGYNQGTSDGYTSGYNQGTSVGYNSGFDAGVAAADARVNPNSASYTAGYSAGTAAEKTISWSVHKTGDSSGSSYITLVIAGQTLLNRQSMGFYDETFDRSGSINV